MKIMMPQDLPRKAKRDQLREILQPTPVENGKFPRWFRLRRGDKLPDFFDHWGRTYSGLGKLDHDFRSDFG